MPSDRQGRPGVVNPQEGPIPRLHRRSSADRLYCRSTTPSEEKAVGPSQEGFSVYSNLVYSNLVPET